MSLASRSPQSIVEPRTTEALGEELTDVFNKVGLALLLSLGHRTGLFESMAGQAPATSDTIAARANLNERYVREWLAGMVASQMVAFDPGGRLYWLPGSHAALFTGQSENLAANMQWITVLAGVEDNVVDAFRHGGGVHYHCFHRFHEVMATDSAGTVVAALEEHILPLEPGLTERLTAGIHVLDLGCGSGRALIALATSYPNSRFVGYDLCEDAIARGRDLVTELNLSNVQFSVKDASNMADQRRFDLVTAFDAIHDQKDPAGVLAGICRALKPGGLFLMQDIAASSYLENNLDHPLGTFLYTISTMHCMAVSLAQGGDGLGTCWGREVAQDLLEKAGFGDVTLHQLPHDIQNEYYLCRPTKKKQGGSL